MLRFDDWEDSEALSYWFAKSKTHLTWSGQEFNMSTMRHMGYHWDDNFKVYFYKMKGSGMVIYNYDDPAEFGTINC